MKRVAVFCGANSGRLPAYTEAASTLGKILAAQKIGLVYGGASIGLMGAVADAAHKAGGEVIGVITEALMAREVGHTGLDDLRIVSNMHERKSLMAQLSDGFIALPGGIGTLEELFEVWTWAHLEIHRKPCGLLNVAGFYTGLELFINHVQQEHFLRPGVREMLQIDSDPERLVDALRAISPD